MRKNVCFWRSAFIGALFAILVLSAAAFAQERGVVSAQLPHGNYTASCGPFMGTGYESLPVLVTSVTSDLNGISVTKVGIENRTDKRLAAVRLVWYLSSQDTPQDILQQGRTKLLNLRRGGGIEAGETREVITPVVAFANIYKPLLRGGVVNGKYLIQVAVGEVRYEDGSTQSLMASGKGRAQSRSLKAAYITPLRPLTQTFCPKQKCEPVLTTDGRPIGYTCIAGLGQYCSNNSTGQACTSGICGSGGGGRPPIRTIN